MPSFVYRVATPQRTAVMAALRAAAGCWVKLDDLAAAVAPFTPDAEAARRFEAHVSLAWKKVDYAPVLARMTPEVRAHRGHRMTAMRILDDLKEDGWTIEKEFTSRGSGLPRGKGGGRILDRLRLVAEGPTTEGRARKGIVSRGSPSRLVILKVLSDNRWHEVDVLADYLVGVVDPGEASRVYVRATHHWRNRRDGLPYDNSKLYGAGLVHKGYRLRVNKMINEWVHLRGAVIAREGVGPRARVRLIKPPQHSDRRRVKHPAVPEPEAAE